MAEYYLAYLTNRSPGHNKHYYIAAYLSVGGTMAGDRPTVFVGWGSIGAVVSDKNTRAYTKGATSEFSVVADAIRYAKGIAKGKIDEGYTLDFSSSTGDTAAVIDPILKMAPSRWQAIYKARRGVVPADLEDVEPVSSKSLAAILDDDEDIREADTDEDEESRPAKDPIDKAIKAVTKPEARAPRGEEKTHAPRKDFHRTPRFVFVKRKASGTTPHGGVV